MDKWSGLSISGDCRAQDEAFPMKAHLNGAMESWVCSVPFSVYSDGTGCVN